MRLPPKIDLQSAVGHLKGEGVQAIVFLNIPLERWGRVAMQHFKPGGQIQEYESILPEAAIEIIKREGFSASPATGYPPSIPGMADGGLANVLAGLASAAQSQGQALDPNTIAALAAMAQGGATASYAQPTQGRFNNFGAPPAANPLTSMLSSMNPVSAPGGYSMGYSSAPSVPSYSQPAYPTSGYRSSAVKPVQSQPMPAAAPAPAGTGSVADILSRLKSLADMQKR